MRTIDLGRAAAQAELIRLKLLLKRQAMRGVWGAVAAVFGLAVLVMVHVIGYLLLCLILPPIWAAVVVLAFDLIVLAVFGLLAVVSKPGRVEVQAQEIRDRALIEMRESVAISALLNPVARVAVKAAGRSAWSAFRPSRAGKHKHRK